MFRSVYNNLFCITGETGRKEFLLYALPWLVVIRIILLVCQRFFLDK